MNKKAIENNIRVGTMIGLIMASILSMSFFLIFYYHLLKTEALFPTLIDTFLVIVIIFGTVDTFVGIYEYCFKKIGWIQENNWLIIKRLR
jgi:hypothetical protein